MHAQHSVCMTASCLHEAHTKALEWRLSLACSSHAGCSASIRPLHALCDAGLCLAPSCWQAAGVSGAAVVAASGELIASLSASDFRAIKPQHLGVLALPVAEFLALQHNTT